MKLSNCIFILGILIGISLLSCSDRPSNVLKEDKMVDLLVDMELAEAYVNTQAFSSQDKEGIGKQVLEAHGVSEETLDTTLAWYGRNMDEYTELFTKVDAEIEKRKEKYVDHMEVNKESDNLWPYSSHMLISPLSGYEAFVFSLTNPDIEKGEKIKLSFSLPNPTGMKGTLGVEYTDGYGESVVTSFTNKRKVEIELQTDSSKQISRLFGVMNLKDKNAVPLYIDSISINKESLDSLTYRSKKRTQKSFGILRQQKEPEKTVNQDTLEDKEFPSHRSLNYFQANPPTGFQEDSPDKNLVEPKDTKSKRKFEKLEKNS